ncbi:MAG: alpha-1,2-fucosyltransferase [Candidatus Levybacteria bacterium CG10_big_fil_rev_8_21_14_0_10_36_7]|nr:MAG: alpha-1,2-fucosyltransferase [Candidatus Levybacteria bacterium CG10_big_fil_rev_8_21_14_0_10_36_7]
MIRDEIITKLQGGLGNQMFQYAIGRHLALKNNANLKLDISYYESEKMRKYGLDVFNITENFATPEEISWFNKFKRRGGKIWVLYNKIFANNKIYVQPKHFHFDPEVLTLKHPLYLNGDWVTEKYFKDIEDTIRKEFTVKNELTGKDKEIAKIITNTNSIGIHIRRADYITDTATTDYHGVCSMEYYDKAVKFIAQKIDNPHFFIFSDDHEWMEQNMNLDFPVTYVSHNTIDKGYADLRLLSMCQHQIIANSTFSWWGAWLNTNPNKIVLAPKKWFNKVKSNVNTKDVIPESWIKL